MKNQITLPLLLESYKTRVEKGEIQFLQKGSGNQREVLDLIQPLLKSLKKAEKEPGGLSVNLDWHETHVQGRSLWEKLVGYALQGIDPVAKGDSELFEFAEATANFEDLLYGMSRYYRDHTLHSLWVYFLGEHILRDHLLDNVYRNLDWYVHNSILSDPSSYTSKLMGVAKDTERELLSSANKKKDAVWCLTALCHDLGYSLSQLKGLNESVERVLKYFDLPGFTRVGYSFEIEHQYLASQFLDLTVGEIWVVPSPDNKEVLIKNFRNDADYWRLCRALEKRQHGAYSSFIIYKLLDIFADVWVRDPAEPWGLDEAEAVDNLIRGNILFAIAQHEFEFAHLSTMGSLADILVLADELEEFSRFGRQLLTRKYNDTMADVSISFKPPKTTHRRSLDIDITYEVAEDYDPKEFYLRKAKKLCRKYSLSEKDDSSRGSARYMIGNIKMVVKKAGIEFSFRLSSDPAKTEGQLPKESTGRYPAGTYRLLCHDDKILVSTEKRDIALEDWFGRKVKTE
ncbi:MAG: hypothetical protein ACETVW_03945 [Dehalococcoidia bacterium]